MCVSQQWPFPEVHLSPFQDLESHKDEHFPRLSPSQKTVWKQHNLEETLDTHFYHPRDILFLTEKLPFKSVSLQHMCSIASASWCAYSVLFLSKGFTEIPEWPPRVRRSCSSSCFLTISSVAASGPQT